MASPWLRFARSRSDKADLPISGVCYGEAQLLHGSLLSQHSTVRPMLLALLAGVVVVLDVSCVRWPVCCWPEPQPGGVRSPR
jgi:hypothetical protein